MSNKSNSFEKIADLNTEQNEIEQLVDITEKLLDKRYNSQNNTALRGVHPKSHGCVKAKFKIFEDIATKYQVGLFAIPGKEYQALIRFSNATSTVVHDLNNKQNLSRGMAIKVLDVAGDEPFLQNDQGARNQDFLMINTASFAFVDIPDYLQLNKILLENNDDPSAFFAPLADPSTCPVGVISSFKVISEIKSKPVENPLGVQYFGAAPFLFGADRVMRFSVIPSNGVKPQQVSLDAAENYLNDALISDMEKQEEFSFDFMVQVRDKGETDLGIEDATKRWDEEEFPFISIGKVTIFAPQLDIDSVESEADCENLIFTPWHSLESHQPLGGISRLRQDVYNKSSTLRGADDPGAICRFARRHDHSTLNCGSSITERSYSDSSVNVYSIDSSQPISASGLLDEWKIYAKNQNPVQLIIYRRSGNSFSVIGKSLIEIPVFGENTFKLTQPIKVAEGDLLGWYSPNAGCIAFVKNNGPWLIPDLTASVVFGNQGSCDTDIQFSSFRTYSIQVNGKQSPKPGGNRIIKGGMITTNQPHTDSGANVYSIDASHPICGEGTLTEWNIYAKNQNPVQLVIYRRSGDSFKVIGKSKVEIPVFGKNRFILDQPIDVSMGDLVGWYNPAKGCIAFNQDHGAWLNNDLNSSVLFGDSGGIDTAIRYSSFRSYSIEVIGK